VSILQGVDSNYKTDLFLPLIHKTQKLTGHTDARSKTILWPIA